MNDSTTTTASFFESMSYAMRSMFYLLTPSETFYEHKYQVPDLPLKSMEVFFGFIFVENIIHLAQEGKLAGSVSDGITSVTAGMLSLIPGILIRGISIMAYEWIYENLRVYDIAWNSIWTYLITLLLVDMSYYWLHRASHEVSVLWAAHQVHHSSEEYNFTTALRQSIFQSISTSFFYFPMAFFIRPSVFLIHSHLNLIYQFWIHTEIVDSCGPLEYVLNTPSHHRVHHGRNPYCIDKNYAGVLIIWDRMFGTFEAEKRDEKIAYGLVHPIETFDALYIQVFVYWDIFKRVLKAESISHALSVMFKGPGWMPGTPRLGYHDTSEFPAITEPSKKLNSRVSWLIDVYVLVHFLFISLFFSEFTKQPEIDPFELNLAIVVLVFNLTCFGWIFDQKSYGLWCEALRCSLFLFINYKNFDLMHRLLLNSDSLHLLFQIFFTSSLSVAGLGALLGWNTKSKSKIN